MDVARCLSLKQKFHYILQKLGYTLFTKVYISPIVSYNSSITLRFKKLLIISNSYAPHIRTQTYTYHNIRKFEVTLLIVMPKTYLLLSI